MWGTLRDREGEIQEHWIPLLKPLYLQSLSKQQFSARLAIGIQGCKMSQEFVAEAVGVSRQAVSKWENGVSDPSTSNLIALAKLFGLSAEELLEGL